MSRTGVWDGRRQNSTGLSQALEGSLLTELQKLP